MDKKIFFLFCCLVFFQQLSAEYKTNVHSISRREGLSNGAVNTIAMDAEGYVWFGTWNGLNRYDGSNIVSFMPGSKPFSLHNHVVRELYPDAKGPLWMLTNKGIGLYDNLHNRFYSFFTDESDQINYENDISLCHSDQFGTIAAVYGKGIFVFDSISRQFIKKIFAGGSAQTSLEVKRLYSIGSEFYCITANNLLFGISGNHLSLIIRLPLDAAISSSLGVLIQNRPYLLITQRGGNAVLVDISAKLVSEVRIGDDIITSFAPSSNPDRLWAGTEKGNIYSLSIASGKLEKLSALSELFVNNPISTRVLSICETTSDILWIGTDGNGVYNLRLSEFPNKSLSSKQLSYPIVRCILVTQKNQFLIGTKGGGIDVFDSKGNHVRQISVKDGLSNNSVLSFLERDDGTIWAGTDGGGIDIISADFRKIRNFPADFKDVHCPGFGSVYNILEDSDQRLYLGTSGFGVMMIEFDKNQPSNPVYCEQVILDKNNISGGQQKQIVYAITQEKPGIIWIGTRGFGVYQYNTITKRVLSQFNSNTHPGQIKNDDILALFTDQAMNIWVGSSSGIFSLKPETNGPAKITGWNLQEDLSNTSIHTMQIDKSGNLWATTNQGLSCVDPKNLTVKNFTVNDGLINFEYSDGASYFDQTTGMLYVGGTMGIDIIQTREIKFSSFFPPMAINDLYIKNQVVEITEGSVLNSRMNLQNRIVLNYDQNALTFYVSPLAYWGKERHRISYRLLNFDNNWVVNLQGQAISFTNLETGNYTLQLRVSDESGNWSDQIKSVEIVIKPPFWKTIWAIGVYILLFIGIQLLIIRSYIRKDSRKKEVALIEFKQQTEKELQNYKLEFFTNVAHEFRTPLTLITSHIHALIEETKTISENPRLLKVYNNSIKLQKLVLEIIQFRKLEKGKEPLNISKVNPEVLVREVISDLELLAQKREILCEVFCDNENTAVYTDADKYQRILTNLVSNAIKYNKPGGFVHVKISFGEKEFITEVEDNGIGINPELRDKVFEPFGISSAVKKGSFPGYRSTGLGLAVTKGIVELLRGTIVFESKPNQGTRFICRFPDIHQENQTGLVAEKTDERNEMTFIDESNNDGILNAYEAISEKQTILLVDDDREILSLLGDMLRPFYNLCFALNGTEAWQFLEQQKIDLVVSDIMMPEMDGIELCCKIRENFDTSHLPLILLTAKVEIEDRIKGLQAGADSYIPKPFHPDHLKIRIEKLLSLRQNIRKKFGSQDESVLLIKEIPDPFFQKMLSYIDENIDEETLSADKLSERFAISKSSLYNKTRSVLGTTPHGLINQRRVRKASVLLGSTSLTVSEIIDQTGFSSRTHFYDLFNKTFGCSPSDYRLKRKD
jgi:signal transduction histidine kinase/DNA-binding response OmpR family regulator/ligand-binding sensor domain-containing protein